MSINFNCCPNLNLGLGSLCSCKEKPRTDSPPLDNGPHHNLMDTMGEPVTLVETEQIQFENIIPGHMEYLYLKIIKDQTVLCVAGGLLDDFRMTSQDFLGISLCSVVKNQELFGGCICPLVRKALENGTAYQFCFKLGKKERLICCSIYPCSIPGSISSVDCVIRPVVSGFRPSLIDKFVLPLDNSRNRPSNKSIKRKTNI